MGKRIDLPAQPTGSTTEQLQKLYSYLYQTAVQLNANLDEIGGMEFTDEEMQVVDRILNPDGAEEGTPAYNYREAETLKSLIVKTANFVQQSLSEYRLNLLGEYVAEGKFGKYVRKTGMDVDITPEGIQQTFALQEIVQGLKTYEINAKNYIKTGYLRTEQMLPVYGVAIGKDVVTFAEDGTETYNDGNKVAELTADELSFWQNGYKIAKYTGSRISFYYGSTEAFYIQNGKIYAAGDLEIVSGKKLIVTTENFSIDSSGNVVVKGSVNITSGKSLAIKSGGAFTVDSGNFSIDSSGNVVLKGAAEILSGKSLEVKSGGSISIKSGGTFSVDSGNFSIDAQGNATFKGGGTFSGALSAATGTFAGTMSAACVTSGTMSCERISGGTLTLGGNNNASGVLIIKDASGTTIGRWDKDGITATTGTFSGNLSGAGGTFSGNLSAAGGTFSGTLNAAGGTFAGTLSAACVTSGTMSCERISGGTLTLGGNNNASGVLVIKNASGTEIGRWDKDGITATTGTFSGNLSGAGGTFSGNLSAAGGTFSGTLNAAGGTFAGTLSAACVTSGTMSCERISGGNLTLGGNNNASGVLIIKDASGNTIGTWDKDGINATTGTFSGTLNAAGGTFAGTMSAACVTSGTMSCERISGGTLTLGGSNNTNGVLVIKDAIGTEIARMSKDGIETSGNLKIKSGGNFQVEAAGAVQIETNANSESYIKLGEGNFNADYQGGITGRILSISDAAYIGGSRILNEALFRNMIHVGPSQPAAGNGVLWFKVSEVLYGRWIKNSEVIDTNADTTSDLTIDGDALTAIGPYRYTLDFDALTVSNNPAAIYATITQANHPGVSVSLGDTGIVAWNRMTTEHVTLSVQSNDILGDTNDNITVTWHVGTQSGSQGFILKDISLKVEGESGGVFNVTEIKYVQ